MEKHRSVFVLGETRRSSIVGMVGEGLSGSNVGDKSGNTDAII